MTDERAAPGSGGDPQIVALLRVIAGLLVVIAIVLLLILARGPQGEQRSDAPTAPAVAAHAVRA